MQYGHTEVALFTPNLNFSSTSLSFSFPQLKGKLIVLCGNCGFENSLSPTEKDDGSCSTDRTTKRRIWREKQMELTIYKHPPGRGLIGWWGSGLTAWLAGILKLVCNFTSWALIIIHFIIQSERLSTLLCILSESSFDPILPNPLTHPWGVWDGQMSWAQCICSVLLCCSLKQSQVIFHQCRMDSIPFSFSPSRGAFLSQGQSFVISLLPEIEN